MKQLKRIAAVLLACALALTMLVGCGGSSSSQSDRLVKAVNAKLNNDGNTHASITVDPEISKQAKVIAELRAQRKSQAGLTGEELAKVQTENEAINDKIVAASTAFNQEHNPGVVSDWEDVIWYSTAATEDALFSEIAGDIQNWEDSENWEDGQTHTVTSIGYYYVEGVLTNYRESTETANLYVYYLATK